MKPGLFDYFVPETLDEALVLLRDLERDGVDVKIMAGGQSLLPLMNMRLATPSAVIDLNGVRAELAYIKSTPDLVSIGAMTRHHELEDSALIGQVAPVVHQAEKLIGHPQIRSRGTIGGSLCHADPSAELPLIFTLLNGQITLRSCEGERTVGAEAFFLSYFMTGIVATEIATEIQLRPLTLGAGQAIEEFSLRHGDFALAVVASQIALDHRQRLTEGRMAVGGAAPVPVDVSEALDSHRGELVTDIVIETVLDDVLKQLEPIDDLHATAQYRLDLVKALGFRAIRNAAVHATTNVEG